MEQFIEAGKNDIAAFDDDTGRAEQFLELARKYTDFSMLTTPMINEFVDRIVVHAPDKSSGERELKLNFRRDSKIQLMLKVAKNRRFN